LRLAREAIEAASASPNNTIGRVGGDYSGGHPTGKREPALRDAASLGPAGE
jgi:hypothetical protein